MSSPTLMLGDTHASWGALNTLINKKKPSLILQCGDFGWWRPFQGLPIISKNSKFDQFDIKNGNCKIHWCDGNHEHFDDLEIATQQTNEVMPNVFYMKRGSTLALSDGRIVLFIGGAESIDREFRTAGQDWFPQESITQQDVYNLPDVPIDIVISHTCPIEFDITKGGERVFLKNKEPSRHALSVVLEKYRPKLWYFGHYHVHDTGFTNMCRWYAMNQATSTAWWRKLDA